MKLEEVQAKKVLQSFGIPVPGSGGLVSKLSELGRALKKAGPPPWVIKAQVQTGGRGKAGGIKTAKNKAQAKKIFSEMLGMKLVTAQTGPDGLTVKKVLIEKALQIKREIYFSVTLDRKKETPVLIASAQGGMEIEILARTAPEKIKMMEVHPLLGLRDFQAKELLFELGLYGPDPKQNFKRSQFFKNCVKAFMESDASLLEINPLALNRRDEMICLDAKLVTDDNAFYRHPELKEFENVLEMSPAERKAKKAGISYVPLRGQIGCLVNGAGLAMATMDLIKAHGGEPSNFLDVGGGANVDQVAAAFEIILSDKNVRSILVNIFGGIMKCDVIAQGIVSAVKKTNLSVPLVVRLEGNRKEEGSKILRESGLKIVGISELSQAVQKAVELSRGQ